MAAYELEGAERALLRRAPPMPSLLLHRGGQPSVTELQADEVLKLQGLDCVVDCGGFTRAGLVMHVRCCRWDVLGRIEETLSDIADALSLLRPGGRLLALLEGDPVEFLTAILAAFPVSTRQVQLPPGASGEACVCICTLDQAWHPEFAVDVLDREVHRERSHRRYAELLETALAGGPYSILDVGGGDGHMAEWWAASGHEIALLEVDPLEASKARLRLGAEKVTLHDGVSVWPYADGTFDVVLLLFVLHHIASEEALRRTLTEAGRVSRRVLVLEDHPWDSASLGLRRLAAAVTAEHFRPFGQDPNVYMRCIRPDKAWRVIFESVGFRVTDFKAVPGTLQHPVPHGLYDLQVLAAEAV